MRLRINFQIWGRRDINLQRRYWGRSLFRTEGGRRWKVTTTGCVYKTLRNTSLTENQNSNKKGRNTCILSNWTPAKSSPRNFYPISFILWFKKQMVTLKSTKKPLTFSDTEYESYHMGFLWFSSVVATWMEFVNYRNDSLQFCTICLAHGLKYYGKCLDVRLFSKAWKGRE